MHPCQYKCSTDSTSTSLVSFLQAPKLPPLHWSPNVTSGGKHMVRPTCILQEEQKRQNKSLELMWSLSSLSLLTLTAVGAPQMTLQQYHLQPSSGNLQTPFLSMLWCYLPISSSAMLSFLLIALSPAESSSLYQRIFLRCGHIIWVSVSSPWLWDHHALQLHSGFCCESPRSSHGLCRKYSEVSYSISSQGLGFFFRVLLSRSSSHGHKGRWIRWAPASAEPRTKRDVWQCMARSFPGNYEEIQHQCQHRTSHSKSVRQRRGAVLLNGSTGDWFRNTVGGRQGHLLSPTLFNIFLERIICEALDDHEGSVSIEGRLITNFRFADDIVVTAEEEEEAGVLVDRLDTTTTRYKMEIGPDKTKVTAISPNDFQRQIKIKGQRLESVESFKYLGSITSNEGPKLAILSRIAQTTAALSRWRSHGGTRTAWNL